MIDSVVREIGHQVLVESRIDPVVVKCVTVAEIAEVAEVVLLVASDRYNPHTHAVGVPGVSSGNRSCFNSAMNGRTCGISVGSGDDALRDSPSGETVIVIDCR